MYNPGDRPPNDSFDWVIPMLLILVLLLLGGMSFYVMLALLRMPVMICPH